MSRVSLIDVRKVYGNSQETIRGVTLDIESGEFVVFVGPSGCGKSTLMRMIAGLESVTSGDILIDGRRSNDVPSAKRGVAMVFQNYALYPHMTVEQNIGFALKMAGESRQDVRTAVHRVAETLQLSHLLDRKPSELSGGQRQRVAIGRAIVRTPGVFLFDEPLSNLDASLRVQMRMELAKLHKSLGKTAIYVTHDQVEAMTLGDRIVVLNEGRIEQVGSPLELYNHPANLFVATFLGSPKMSMVPCEWLRNEHGHLNLRAGAGLHLQLPFPQGASLSEGEKVSVGIRAEDFTLVPPGQGWPAEVEYTENLGDMTLVYAKLQGVDGLVTAKLDRLTEVPGTGDAIGLVVDPRRVHVFDHKGMVLKIPE